MTRLAFLHVLTFAFPLHGVEGDSKKTIELHKAFAGALRLGDVLLAILEEKTDPLEDERAALAGFDALSNLLGFVRQRNIGIANGIRKYGETVTLAPARPVMSAGDGRERLGLQSEAATGRRLR
jgi:hypothetical protein